MAHLPSPGQTSSTMVFRHHQAVSWEEERTRQPPADFPPGHRMARPSSPPKNFVYPSEAARRECPPESSRLPQGYASSRDPRKSPRYAVSFHPRATSTPKSGSRHLRPTHQDTRGYDPNYVSPPFRRCAPSSSTWDYDPRQVTPQTWGLPPESWQYQTQTGVVVQSSASEEHQSSPNPGWDCRPDESAADAWETPPEVWEHQPEEAASVHHQGSEGGLTATISEIGREVEHVRQELRQQRDKILGTLSGRCAQVQLQSQGSKDYSTRPPSSSARPRSPGPQDYSTRPPSSLTRPRSQGPQDYSTRPASSATRPRSQGSQNYSTSAPSNVTRHRSQSPQNYSTRPSSSSARPRRQVSPPPHHKEHCPCGSRSHERGVPSVHFQITPPPRTPSTPSTMDVSQSLNETYMTAGSRSPSPLPCHSPASDDKWFTPPETPLAERENNIEAIRERMVSSHERLLQGIRRLRCVLERENRRMT